MESRKTDESAQSQCASHQNTDNCRRQGNELQSHEWQFSCVCEDNHRKILRGWKHERWKQCGCPCCAATTKPNHPLNRYTNVTKATEKCSPERFQWRLHKMTVYGQEPPPLDCLLFGAGGPSPGQPPCRKHVKWKTGWKQENSKNNLVTNLTICSHNRLQKEGSHLPHRKLNQARKITMTMAKRCSGFHWLPPAVIFYLCPYLTSINIFNQKKNQ